MQESIYITDRKYKQEIGNTLTGNILITVSKKLYLNWQLQSVVLNIADQVKVVLNKNNLPCVFSDMFGRYQLVRSMSFVVTYFQIFFFSITIKRMFRRLCVYIWIKLHYYKCRLSNLSFAIAPFTFKHASIDCIKNTRLCTI